MTKYDKLINNIKAISKSKELDWGDYYKRLNLPYGGLCFGFAYMWAQAVLANDTQTFYSRLDILTKDYADYENSLVDQIEQQQLLPKQQWCNTYEQNLVSEIRAFLDGLLLYHFPEISSLSKELPTQSYMASSYVIPQNLAVLDKNGLNKPLQRIFHIPICGTNEEIKEHINTIFFQTRKEMGTQVPFVAILNSENHAIGLAYNNDNLELYDANIMSLPNQSHSITVCQDNMRDNIFKSFPFAIESDKLALDVSIYISPKEIRSENDSSSLQSYKQEYLAELEKTPSYAGINSFLHVACRHGHLEIVRLLIQKGANINQTNKNTISPLYIACQNGHLEIVRLLLEKGADIKQTNKNGASPFVIACHRGHLEIAKLLLEKGADINQANKNIPSPLYIACLRGHLEVVALLFEHVANNEKFEGHGNKEFIEKAPTYIQCFLELSPLQTELFIFAQYLLSSIAYLNREPTSEKYKQALQFKHNIEQLIRQKSDDVSLIIKHIALCVQTLPAIFEGIRKFFKDEYSCIGKDILEFRERFLDVIQLRPLNIPLNNFAILELQKSWRYLYGVRVDEEFIKHNYNLVYYKFVNIIVAITQSFRDCSIPHFFISSLTSLENLINYLTVALRIVCQKKQIRITSPNGHKNFKLIIIEQGVRNYIDMFVPVLPKTINIRNMPEPIEKIILGICTHQQSIFFEYGKRTQLAEHLIAELKKVSSSNETPLSTDEIQKMLSQSPITVDMLNESLARLTSICAGHEQPQLIPMMSPHEPYSSQQYLARYSLPTIKSR